MKKLLIVPAVLFCSVLAAAGAYAWYFSDRIVPRTWVGSVPLGGLTRDQAVSRLQSAVDRLQSDGIRLNIEGIPEGIQPDDIGLDLNLGEAVDLAFARGHGGSNPGTLFSRVSSLWQDTRLSAPVHLDRGQLKTQLDQVAAAVDVDRRDIRLAVAGTEVKLLTDTAPGRIIDREQAAIRIMAALRALDGAPISLTLQDDPPVADPALAGQAVVQAQKMLARPLLLLYEDAQFFVSRDTLGSWLTSVYHGPQLVAALDRTAVGEYVTGIAVKLNVAPEPPHLSTEAGRVTGFTPPKVGRAVQEDKLVAMIIGAVTDRTGKDRTGDNLTVPLKTTKMSLTGLNETAGITELIGKATTPMTGSPRNRISNIKNGVKFLSGTVIGPGQEFSTLGTLGTIDNTTGYLPELVIKGDRTTPDFGGGLCQVSTTLFRAVMDSALPVTARRNHSYRVSYYEKDGTGKVIGPGLDATIYDPDLDFKFRNDTATPILIIGYVIGDKVTFELYGTKDGRTGHIDGPHLLTETPPGDAKYIQTPDLPPGAKKQVETPHPGGSAVATYSITYPGGRTVSQEFKSTYRRWPAQYLVGTGGVIPSPSVAPVVSP